MSFDLEHINCNLCEKSNTKLYATVSYMDYLNRRPELKSDDDPILQDTELANYKFNLVRCKNCGLVYVNPRLTSKSLEDFYKGEYFSYYVDTGSEAHKKRQETMRTEIIELKNLAENLGLGSKLLDIGCGGGFFLNNLKNSWEKYGIEINPAAVKYAIDNFRINVVKGNLLSANFHDDMFDVVTMRGTIEHLLDPITELREIYRILTKGGLIAINTPNIGGFCGRIYKEKFRMVCPTHHIYYFSTKTLSTMLKKVGFRVKKVSYHYFDTPYSSYRNILKILYDLLTLRVFRETYVVSPPFYGNILDIYSIK